MLRAKLLFPRVVFPLLTRDSSRSHPMALRSLFLSLSVSLVNIKLLSLVSADLLVDLIVSSHLRATARNRETRVGMLFF